MQTRLEASIVRIFSTTNNSVVGTGFLVDKTFVLTCAHVVAKALGLAADTSSRPEAEIYLDFPLIEASGTHTARVISWYPPCINGSDIALLRLSNNPPKRAMSTRLVVSEDFYGHNFSAFGFPQKYDDGVWASGKLCRKQATGWIQIEDVKEAGNHVEQGFSGGAARPVGGWLLPACSTSPVAKYAYKAGGVILAGLGAGRCAVRLRGQGSGQLAGG